MSDQTEMTPSAPGIFRRNAPMLLLGVVTAIVVVGSTLGITDQRATLRADQAVLSDATVELRQAKLAEAERVNSDVMAAVGVNQARLTKDTAIITKLTDLAFTWDSGMSYETARESMKSAFKLDEATPFMQDFLPPARFNQDEAGRRYYYIDAQGMNSAPKDEPEVEVVWVRADQYRYAVLADVRITSDDVDQRDADLSEASVVRSMLLFVTIDSSGALSDVEGIPASGSTRYSG